MGIAASAALGATLSALGVVGFRYLEHRWPTAGPLAALVTMGAVAGFVFWCL